MTSWSFSSPRTWPSRGKLSPGPRIFRFGTAPAGRVDRDPAAWSHPPALGLRPRRALSSVGAQQDWHREHGLQESDGKGPLMPACLVLPITKCPALPTAAVQLCPHRDTRYCPGLCGLERSQLPAGHAMQDFRCQIADHQGGSGLSCTIRAPGSQAASAGCTSFSRGIRACAGRRLELPWSLEFWPLEFPPTLDHFPLCASYPQCPAVPPSR